MTTCRISPRRRTTSSVSFMSVTAFLRTRPSGRSMRSRVRLGQTVRATILHRDERTRSRERSVALARPQRLSEACGRACVLILDEWKPEANGRALCHVVGRTNLPAVGVQDALGDEETETCAITAGI